MKVEVRSDVRQATMTIRGRAWWGTIYDTEYGQNEVISPSKIHKTIQISIRSHERHDRIVKVSLAVQKG